MIRHMAMGFVVNVFVIHFENLYQSKLSKKLFVQNDSGICFANFETRKEQCDCLGGIGAPGAHHKFYVFYCL